MELLQLKYFYESAKLESFAKTARKYMVPASSVSASVKRLESELGCKLFDRSKNGIKLNEKGSRFFSSVGYIFNELDIAISELKNIEQKEICVLIKAMRSEVFNAVIKFKKMHPDIEFKVHFDAKELNDDRFDIVVGTEELSYEKYRKEELCRRRIYLRACKGSYLVGKKLNLKELSHEPFVTMGKNTFMHHLLVEACERVGFSPNIVVEVNDMFCYNKCLNQGLGIALSRSGGESPLNAVLDVVDFNESLTYYVYLKTSSTKNTTAEQFIAFLKSELKKA